MSVVQRCEHTRTCTLVYTQLFKKLLLSYSVVSDSATPCTVARQAPLSTLQEELLLLSQKVCFQDTLLFFSFLASAYILLFIEAEFIKHNINLLKNLFIFGCTESSLLHLDFL